MNERQHFEILRAELNRSLMIVTAILVASLNLSQNPYYYRAAGITALIIGLVGYGMNSKLSTRVFKLNESSEDTPGFEDNETGMFLLHLAVPIVLVIGGLVVFIITVI